MKIALNAAELKKCNELLRVKESNISTAEIYIDFLTNNARNITKFDIEKLTKKYPIEEAYFKAFLRQEEILENDEEFSEYNADCNIKNINRLNPNDYLCDEYIKKIQSISAKENDWYFSTMNYLPFEGFVYDELEVNEETYAEHTPVGFFTEKFPYFAVVQGDDIWMSIIPHEINTMKDSLSRAHGDVLVLGLGLGYYLFHVLRKSNVKKVTIIEKDPTICGLFRKYLLPQFENTEKLNIIEGDALEYLSTTRKHDYVFADLWHNVGDGEKLYLQLKALEKNVPGATFDYWIERSILCMLRRQMLTIFEEQQDGYDASDYVKYENDNDFIINRLFDLTKDITIDSYKKLHDLLSEASLKELAKSIF